jgi:AraC-like DNA-binding protein
MKNSKLPTGKNECSKTSEPSSISAMNLSCVWKVDDGPAYDCEWDRSGERRLIAIRTLEGSGRMFIRDRGIMEIPSQSLLFVEVNSIRRYHTVGDRWRFWWFEFTVSGTLPVPLYSLMRIVEVDDEEKKMRGIFQDLLSVNTMLRCRASAIFTNIVYNWSNAWSRERKITPAKEAVERVISMIHQRIQTGFPIKEMSKVACMSERGFRQVFTAETGISPKKYFDNVRLEQAHSLLHLGAYSVSEVAWRLGYANPFHLSKAFKSHFGMAPSKVSGKY